MTVLESDDVQWAVNVVRIPLTDRVRVGQPVDQRDRRGHSDGPRGAFGDHERLRRAAGQSFADAAEGLADALLVLDECEADERVAGLAEADAR